ncbi:extensin family protein [Jiella sp. M17.18]|uniref:extensin family protein n=1 Tax=Jiella sp. M17.18 TaxID=3234247 RepID=UPI0034DF3763
MVLRSRAGPFGMLAVAALAAAGHPGRAEAQDWGRSAARAAGGTLVWGGRMPQPGDGYVPSVPDPAAPPQARVSPAPANDGAPDRSAVPPQDLSPADQDAPAEALTEPPMPAAAVDAGSSGQGALPDETDAAPQPDPPAASPGWSLQDDLLGHRARRRGTGAPLSEAAPTATPPPLAAPISIGPDVVATGESVTEDGEDDPWAGLKQVTPGAVPQPPVSRPRTTTRLASLEPPDGPSAGADALPGRGELEAETPDGYQPMPRAEALCRAALRKLNVTFVDISPIGRGRSCGIEHPVKVLAFAGDVAVKPAAILNCPAAARISQWVENEVKPAARWKLWERPVALLNASSYRCSRIAGTRTISEHASGNALDVRGFVFADGSTFDVEKKGFFSFREKSFQRAIRTAGCRYFGTVLGPGYNYDHRNHLHLDVKPRRRVVCR